MAVITRENEMGGMLIADLITSKSAIQAESQEDFFSDDVDCALKPLCLLQLCSVESLRFGEFAPPRSYSRKEVIWRVCIENTPAKSRLCTDLADKGRKHGAPV